MPPSEAFVTSRVFDAPRDLVWKAWTEADRLMRWFGPKGATLPACKLDLRPGGVFHYCLRTPDGHEMWGKWVFREIEASSRLVLINSFSDADGGLTRHPMAPTWPLEMLSTTTFEDLGDRTLLTLRWEAFHASAEEQATFDAGHAGMAQGWGGTMDQLAAYLAEAARAGEGHRLGG